MDYGLQAVDCGLQAIGYRLQTMDYASRGLLESRMPVDVYEGDEDHIGLYCLLCIGCNNNLFLHLCCHPLYRPLLVSLLFVCLVVQPFGCNIAIGTVQSHYTGGM